MLTGCQYECPLAEEDKIAIDSAVLGLWERIPAEGEEQREDVWMLILQYH